jgi:hypothetical protein
MAGRRWRGANIVGRNVPVSLSAMRYGSRAERYGKLLDMEARFGLAFLLSLSRVSSVIIGESPPFPSGVVVVLT